MTMAISARVAGLTLLVYIVAGVGSLILTQSAVGNGEIADALANAAQNSHLLRYAALLDLLCAFCALTLGVTLYALTSAHGVSAAMLAMACRFVEAVLIAVSLSENLGALWLAPQAAENGEAVRTLASYLLRSEVTLTSTFFAVGSLIFACLFVRGRSIPAPLAWLGVFASVTLVLVLPLQLVGLIRDPRLTFAWLPMLAFEVPLGLWFLFRKFGCKA